MKHIVTAILVTVLFQSTTCGIVVLDEALTTSAPGFAPAAIWNSTTGDGVHIGNGWYLTAAHVSGSATRFQTLWLTSIGGDGSSLINSDLAIYQGTDLGAPVFNVGCSTPTVGDDVLMIARGGSARLSGNPTTSLITWDSAWVESTDPLYNGVPTHQGYLHGGSTVKRWGTNEISSRSYFSLNAGNPPPNLTLGFSTDFSNLPSEAEAQVESGDSGGPVFLNGPNGWELAGIISGKSLTLPGQPANTTLLSTPTNPTESVMSDISFYRSAIEDHIEAETGTAIDFCSVTAVPEPSALLLLCLLVVPPCIRKYAFSVKPSDLT